MDQELEKWKCEILYCNCCKYEDYFLMIMTSCGLKNIYQLLEECNDISFQFPNNVEFKFAKFLQLIGSIKRTIFRKVRKEIILKTDNT